jgi:ABC-type antimicrobial peptide transport system permease subunit
MLRSVLITAIRHFSRHQVFSIISLSGLVLGVTAAMLLFIWVADELNYDRYHPDNDRVFMILRDVQLLDGQKFIGETNPGPLADYIKSSVPEVEEMCQMGFNERLLLSTKNEAIYADGSFAEPTYWDVFNLDLVEGNRKSIFSDNQSIALSRKVAEKIFKGEKALGNVVSINNQAEFKVTAVYDIPENSSKADGFILPFSLHRQREISTWDDSNGYIYVKLLDPATRKSVEEKLTAKLHQVWETKGTRMFLFPLTDWHLYWNYVVLLQPTSRMLYVVAFSIVGFFILVMACINFINLSTARAAVRAREIGVRKMSGATRPVLIRQFMTESFFITITAVSFSVLFVYLLMPLFNTITGKDLAFTLTDPKVAFGIVIIILITGILAGGYPAFLLSSLKPATVLKGNLYSALTGGGLRKGLVVFQFGLSVILIFSAIVIQQQIDYLRSKNLGFDKDNVLYVELGQYPELSAEVFKNEALQNPNIQNVAQAAATPMEINGIGEVSWRIGNSTQTMNINNNPIDYDYLQTLGFKFVAGRNFLPDRASDSTAVIITKTTASLMGFNDPIGQVGDFGFYSESEIIGVVEDFHNADIHDATAPVFFYLGNELTWGRWKPIFVRYKPGTQREVIMHLNEVGRKLSLNRPLEFRFVDQDFEYQFRRDNRIGTLSICFTVIAVIIACLGLFGLTLFNTQRRTKEIGVRKVLGASVLQVVVLLCKDFSRPILLALVVSLPVAYYLMNDFLMAYRFHTEITMASFFLTGFVLIVLALLTVLYQSIQAAQKNPVEALKTE